MADHERVLKLLQDNVGTKFPTYDLAKELGIQANTVQRCINHNLKSYVRSGHIQKERIPGGNVKRYWWSPDGHVVEEPKYPGPHGRCPRCNLHRFFSTNEYRGRRLVRELCDPNDGGCGYVYAKA